MILKIGVLALQGAFAKHAEMLRSLGVEVVEVRKPADLDLVEGLIIPGGESTTILRQMRFIKLEEKLLEFASQKPLFGTCAGLILMSQEVLGDSMQPFGLIEMSIERNAFGRQADSFSRNVKLTLETSRHVKSYKALFIRAPRIKRLSDNVQVLATLDDEPILVQQGKHLACTFHPELTEDPAIHSHFIQLCSKKGKKG